MDWAAAAGVALTRLGWSPGVFWAATPAELRLALKALTIPQGISLPLGRRELETLRNRFPDRLPD
ncbi:MAG: phage tail assembly chaperone [Sphingomonadales bacterium]|nr:phage tail assembly chaperone [Sphingomonadales bacterium]